MGKELFPPPQTPHTASFPLSLPGQLTHEVVVPGALCWDHEEAEEAVGQEHLHPLIVGGEVTLGIVPFVRVLPAPLVPARGQFVGCQRAGARGETEKEKT